METSRRDIFPAVGSYFTKASQLGTEEQAVSKGPKYKGGDTSRKMGLCGVYLEKVGSVVLLENIIYKEVVVNGAGKTGWG